MTVESASTGLGLNSGCFVAAEGSGAGVASSLGTKVIASPLRLSGSILALGSLSSIVLSGQPYLRAAGSAFCLSFR